MAEREARARAVYDHDNEELRPSGRRRRQVADWGVGEELFDGMPGRPSRFERRSHREPPREDIPRGDAHDGRRTIVIETGDDELPLETLEPAEEEFASRDEALRAREVDDELWAGDEPFARREPEPLVDEPVDEAGSAEIGDVPLAHTEDIVRGTQEGRRTVKIGGRPAEFYGPPARARQRPPRTMHERLGPRPERIAAWAFALGLLLILIAVATSNI